MRKGLGVATKYDIHMPQIAIDPDSFGGDHQEVGRRGTFFLRAVFGVGANVDNLAAATIFVFYIFSLRDEGSDLSNHLGKVLARCDHSPAADGVQAHGNRLVRQQGRCLLGAYLVGVVDSEREEGLAVFGALAILALNRSGSVFVAADDGLGAEVARSEPVDSRENPRHIFRLDGAKLGVRVTCAVLKRLGQGCSNVTREGVVPGHGLIGSLENDHVLLAGKGTNNVRLRERPQNIDMDGADSSAASRPQVVYRSLDVLCRGAKRHEDRVGIFAHVLGQEAVMAACELAPFVIGLLEELVDRLDKAVSPGRHAIHVMFLVLDRANEGRALEVDDPGNAAARRPEESLLRFRRTLDNVIGAAKKLAQEVRLALEEGSLEMGCKKAILDVHSRRQRSLGDAPQNHRLVGGLLGVAGKKHDPAGVERPVNIIMSAVYIEGMLGKGARGDLENHSRKLSGGVIVLLNAIDDSLPGGEVHGAAAGNGIGDRSALGGMLPFTFDGYFRFTKDAELALGVGLLVHLSHFGRRGDGVEDSPIRDARLGIVGNQLIAVGGDALAGIRRHACLGRRGLFVWYDCHCCFWVFLPAFAALQPRPLAPSRSPLDKS